MRRVEEAVRPFPKAALFQLAEDGYGSPFEQLVACMISIRTRDEATIVIARNLFSHARTPAEFADLSPEVIDEWIHQSSFHENKAVQIRDIARRVLSEYDGQLPCDEALLLSLPGIGPKCARLVLGIACGTPLISVDVHVDRVTNRWGYVRAPRPEATMVALEAVLPQRYWLDINRLLVPFGKH
ncbi:MAG: endonuclease III, partial [Chloroflexi bacterium]|nr:endonuclease III [Chloroflexota bacterium]